MLNKRFIPIVLVTALLAIIALFGYLLPETDDAVPKRIAMINTGGPVVFEHGKHEKWAESCLSCHHELVYGAEKPMACNQCHGVTVNETFVAEHVTSFSEESCIVCHHYVPGSQDWGHAMHSESLGLDCTSCHHADTSIEETPSNCADCHEAGKAPSRAKFVEGEPPSLADAVHSKCISCHEEWFSKKARGCVQCHFDKAPASVEPGERLHKNMETQTCSACHEQKIDKLLPNRMQAHHASCMGCHTARNAGPRTQQDCAQCHMK